MLLKAIKMIFDWHLAFLSLTGGLILLLGAALSRSYEKAIFAPATAMLLTWGGALLALSFLPLMGFYHLSVEAVLLYVLGSGWFALVAILTSWVSNKYSKPAEHFSRGPADRLNFSRVVLLWAIIAVIAYPLAVLNVLSFGSNIGEISYNIRKASVSGETILHPIVSNLFVLLGVLANIVLYGVTQKKVKLMSFVILVAPLVVISLIVAGRSGLVSMILGWLVILAVFSDKLKLRYLALPILFLFFVLYFGGLWVKKFDVESQSAGNALFVLFDHIFGYLFQGPVLFSRYFTGEINPETNWDFLNSACHMLSKLDFCKPLPQHQSFSQYGIARFGNVYSIYYSVVPIYGVLGVALVFGVYAVFMSVLFRMLKRISVFSIVVYPTMFAAVVLSLFTDGIGYSFYWIVKVSIICLFLRLIFSEKKVKFKRLVPID